MAIDFARAPHAQDRAVIKTAAGRIDDTLELIRHSPPLPEASMRMLVRAVHAFAEAFAGRDTRRTDPRYVVDSAERPVTARRFSAEMSILGVPGAWNKNDRAMRRAIFLLWSAMEDPQTAAHAKSILVGDLTEAFRDALQKALRVEDQRGQLVRGPEMRYRKLRHGS